VKLLEQTYSTLKKSVLLITTSKTDLKVIPQELIASKHMKIKNKKDLQQTMQRGHKKIPRYSCMGSQPCPKSNPDGCTS